MNFENTTGGDVESQRKENNYEILAAVQAETDHGYVTVLFGNYLPNYMVSYHKTFRGGEEKVTFKG